MTLLSLFALVLPAALVAPKATKRETRACKQSGRLSPIEQTLAVQPISPATALALPHDWRVCSPSRADVMTKVR